MKKELAPRHVPLRLISVALLLIGASACSKYETGTGVIVSNPISGTSPYSNNPVAPDNWKCIIPPGPNTIDSTDVVSLGGGMTQEIVEIDGCWTPADNSSIELPKPTSTPYPTPDVWVPATPPGSHP